jgi:hypothetical protein
MNPQLSREISLLEQNLIEDFPRWKRNAIKALLTILDRMAKLQSRMFSPERVLGIDGDAQDVVHLAQEVKTIWQHISAGLKPTDQELLMELLALRDVTVAQDRLQTPQGQFLVQ